MRSKSDTISSFSVFAPLIAFIFSSLGGIAWLDRRSLWLALVLIPLWLAALFAGVGLEHLLPGTNGHRGEVWLRSGSLIGWMLSGVLSIFLPTKPLSLRLNA